MDVSLPPQLEDWIHQKVMSGMYESEGEVIRAALRLLLERDALRQERLAELRRDIAIGLSQLEETGGSPFDAMTVEHIKAKGRERRGLD